MDEFGHLIDSGYLDSAGGDHKVHNQDTETPQTAPHADDTNPENLSKFVSAQSPASAQSLSTLAEKDGNTYADATAAQTQKEPHNIQGGSASGSWLGSSLTGWFGLTAVEKSDSMAEGEEQDKIQPEASLTSTVTGWLGIREQEKPDDVKKTTEEVSVNADSLASTVTGFLGFGGKEKPDHMSEREQDTEKVSGLEQEPGEKYRSRRMSMNTEDTDEEAEGTSTLEWLGNGLSHRFGLSLSNQESEHAEPTYRYPKQTTTGEEQPSSWFDMGIGDILGFKKEKIDVDGSTGSNFMGIEKPTEQSTDSENVNSGQSQLAMTEEVMTETSSLSEVVETQKDKSDPPEIEVSPGSVDSVTDDSNGDDMHQGTLDSGKDRLPTEGLAYSDVQKDIPTQVEVKSQAVGGMSSIFNGLFHIGRDEDVQDNVLEESPKRIFPVDGEQSAEMENKEHQMPNSIEEIKRKPEEENASVTNQGFTTQNLAATYSSQEHSDFLGPPTGKDGKIDSKEKADIPDFKDNTDVSLSTRASPDGEDGGHDAERALPNRDNPTPRGQASEGVNDHIACRGIIQPILSSGSAGEYREQVSNEDDNITNQVTSVDHFNSLLMTDKMPEDAEDIVELIQSPHSEDGSIRNMSADVSEDDIEKKTQMTTDDNNITGQKSETDAGPDIIQEDGVGDDVLKETALQTAVDLETETEEMEKHKTTEDVMRKEKEVKPPDNQLAANEVELEEVTAMENGIEGEETPCDEDEINKDKGEVVQTAPKQVTELTLEVEKVRKVEKQQKEFSTNVEKPEDKVQESKEDQKKEEEALAEEKRIDDGQSSHFKADMENILQTETQSEGSSTTFTQTETLQDEEEGSDHGEKVKKMKEEDSQENVKDEQMDGSECLKDHCSEAPADSLARDRDGITLGTEWSSTHREGTQTGEQHLSTERDPDIAERTGGNDFEKDESRKQEEKDNLDSAANEESTGNESNGADNMKGISDNSKDLQYSFVTDDDHLLSTEGENTSCTEDSILHQGEKNKSDIETVNNSTSDDHNVDTVENSGKTEVLKTKDDDTAGPNLGPEVRTENSVSQHPTSSFRLDGKNKAEDESGGGFSLLKGAFGYFSQTSASKLVRNLDSIAGEVQGSLTPDPELDLTTVYDQGVLTVPSITPPQPSALHESQPSPPPIQPPPLLHPQPKSLSANPHHLHQTKSLSKHYKSLLTHMSVDEIAILLEHFGRHKLQFLDYICGSSQPMTEELDHDESILLDVERLLHYHLEALTAPGVRLTDPPQEEKEKTRTLIALEKLQMLVARVKEMFSRRKLDIRSTYHQGISACIGQD